MKIDVSIIIVYFEGWRDFAKCLTSIQTHKTKYEYEVIIVNNGNEAIQKKVYAIVPDAKYIKNKKNTGYGAGNNVGARIAKGENLFILNPDIELQKGAIDTLCDFLKKKKEVAVVAPNLVHPNGTIYTFIGTRELTPLSGLVSHSFLNKLFPRNPISINYFLLDTKTTQIRQAFSVPGCAFMIRKNVFFEVGTFDEHIFLYYEESDLGKRLLDANYKVYILPTATVIHNQSFDANPLLKKYNAQSRLYYFKKYYGLVPALIVEAFCRFSKKAAIVAFLAIISIILIFKVV